MSAALHIFPTAEGDERRRASPAPVFATFNPPRTVDLLASTRNSVSTAELLLNFVHKNRNVARQSGIETIVIEIFAIMQSSSFSGVMDTLEEAVQKGQSSNLSHTGLETIRRFESLIAEASANILKFTDGDFIAMELAEENARLEADSQKAYIEMEERRIDGMRRELALKESNARRSSETVHALRSSLGFVQRSPDIAQADQSKSSDLSILIPFAIFSAILATVAVVAIVVKDK